MAQAMNAAFLGTVMQDLRDRIVAATGLDPRAAEDAIGVILGFFQKHAPPDAFADFLGAVPGAEDAIAAAAVAPAKGGLLGALGGMMGGLGGGAGELMALASQLSSKGLDMAQMKDVGREIFEFAEQRLGQEKAREIMQAIPGVGRMIG